MAQKWTFVFALVAVTLLTAAGCYAAKLEIGDDAPNFSGIIGTDDKQHSLSDYKEAKLIVLVFTCNHCPVAKAYEDRLIALQKDYKSKGLQVIAACVNDRDGDRLPAMKKRAAGKDLGNWRKHKGPFNFPYIYDETQKIARDYAATVTPHIFVLDKKRKIGYMGAIDDNNNPDKVKEHWLRDGLDALLAGKEPPKAVTQQRGCTIKWKEEK